MDNTLELKTKIDLDSYSSDEVNEMGKALGTNLGLIGDEAAAKMNELLDAFGLSAKLQIHFFNKETGEKVSLTGV